MAKKIVPASVRRTIEGYRDTGYSFESAIADLIDNSIEARATAVSVTVRRDLSGAALVRIADNGCGMDLDALENAMRYGSDEVAERHRLGRFGLGLKTASTTFCRRLTVITRPEGAGSDLFAATWDLDAVEAADDWILEIGPATAEEADIYHEEMARVSPELEKPTGTVVSWSKVDRLLVKRQGGDYADPQAALDRRIEGLVGNLDKKETGGIPGHLPMVFQRFLDEGDARSRNLRIFVNGTPVAPWDPFCEAFAIEPTATRTWPLKDDVTGEVVEILVRDFILPRWNEHPAGKAFRRAAAQAGAARQGFFIYREGRLVDKPGWFGMFTNDSHQAGHRIELSFPATVDEYFGVGVKKEGLTLDPGLYQVLREWVQPKFNEAQKRDKHGENRDEVARRSGLNPIDRTISAQREGLDTADVSGREDGSVDLSNNRTTDDPISVLEAGGVPNSRFRLVVSPSEEEVYVLSEESLTDGVLWEPGLRTGGRGDSQVRVNVGHEWYRRTYVPNKDNSVLCQGLDLLLYALAVAELNNTDEDLISTFQEFRVEVSRNLRRLVVDLPEPDAD